MTCCQLSGRAVRASILLVAMAECAHAQSPTPAQFDAASVKASNAPAETRAGRLQFTPGRVFGTNVPARELLLEAYRLKSYQLFGGPKWLDSTHFDIEAKADNPATENQLRPMLQSLLAERFQLVAHHDTREMPVYALTIGKTGLKLREVKEGEPKPPPPRTEPGALMAEYTILKMQDFADNLSRVGEIGRPVLNRTGLQGTYAFDLQLFEGQDFIVMVLERCGLKFESQRTSIDILVIDRVERPSGN
jgi:uncharacterized protein (TIGR03435 family)